MDRREYEHLLEEHIGWLKKESSDAQKTGTREAFERELSLGLKIEETEKALWNSRALSQGNQSREQAEKQMASENRVITLPEHLEPTTPGDVDERLERAKREFVRFHINRHAQPGGVHVRKQPVGRLVDADPLA